MSEETEAIGDDLTPKQKMFCEEYLIDLNATQAAIRAGYSAKTASSISSENLLKPEIQEYIERLTAKRNERNEITQDSVLDKLKRFHAVSSQEVPVMVFNPESKQYEQQLDRNGDPVYRFIDPFGAAKSIEMLGKHTGTFEKHNNQKQPTTQIVITKRIIEKGDKRD